MNRNLLIVGGSVFVMVFFVGLACAMGGSPPGALITKTSASPSNAYPFEVVDFQAEIVVNDGKKAQLSWVNPADDKFAGVIVVVRTDRYPENPKDINDQGQVLAQLKGGQGEQRSFKHALYHDPKMKVKTKDPTQYYLIITYDKDGNYSNGMKGSLRGMII